MDGQMIHLYQQFLFFCFFVFFNLKIIAETKIQEKQGGRNCRTHRHREHICTAHNQKSQGSDLVAVRQQQLPHCVASIV